MSVPIIREPQKIPIKPGRWRTKCGLIHVFMRSNHHSRNDIEAPFKNREFAWIELV